MDYYAEFRLKHLIETSPEKPPQVKETEKEKFVKRWLKLQELFNQTDVDLSKIEIVGRNR